MLANLGLDLNQNKTAEEKAYVPFEKKKRGRADLPYPEVYIRQKDPKYVGLLLDLFAGVNGEFTASSQYIYQILFSGNEYPDIKEILDAISRCEMRHLFIVGDMIQQLGGDPRFWTQQNNKNKMWDAGSVHYIKSPKRMLLDDIENEMAQIRNYKITIDSIEDEEITHLLQRNKMDEDIHLQLLVGLYEKYK